MFRLSKVISNNKDDLSCEEFQKLMLSPLLEKAFRRLLTDIRYRCSYNDFSMVGPEPVGFLPSDLRLMLGYLYKRSVR